MKKVRLLMLIVFMTAASMDAFAADLPPLKPGSGRISGKVIDSKGVSVISGRVFFYNEASGPPPSLHQYWRIPNVVGQLDKDGSFARDLPAGTYYIQALKRTTNIRMFGVPMEGDLVGIGVDGQGTPKRYVVKEGEQTDAGVIANIEPFVKEKEKMSITGIEGVITGEDKKPVEGAIVFVYYDSQMNRQPVFGSEKTGKDGKFFVRVDKGGTYYLKVRDEYRSGSPVVTGGLLGMYGEQKPAPITVKTGETVTKKNIKTKKLPSLAPQKN